MLFDALAPEHIVTGADEHDPHVSAISIPIDHDRHQQSWTQADFFIKLTFSSSVAKASADKRTQFASFRGRRRPKRESECMPDQLPTGFDVRDALRYISSRWSVCG